MSNIYEALEQASGKKNNSEVTPELSLQTEVIRGVSLRKEMVWLHHQVETCLSNTASKIIQFVGSRRGEGVSTIVREFAKNAVERHGKSVLILDSTYKDHAGRVCINGARDYGWLDFIEEGKLIDKAFFRVGDSNLYFAPISVQESLMPLQNDLPLEVNLWEKLKERFDLILIDTSSNLNSFESIGIARNADGVIMVIEAGVTKKTTAAKLKKLIVSNGGTIVGAILNKRRYYIPEFIYRKFF
ncbi:hypothetical protein GMLC_32320 [Geomonas limicola]|uniref:AAA domain-containing protein n=1 Tax=Geomonas limicola TaxID=2740186 RepID=A0A6V8NDL7_9BACT|nr:chromosome partitioning protein [Geomonas limicola]GFO69653.1 hypothetical protein GMLC_32320 [Geomonas limicola]